MSVDVVTLGEAMLRLSVPTGIRLPEMNTLQVSVGGAESNVAVALARMGCSTAWISALPDNELGRHALGHLNRHGVDTRFVVSSSPELQGELASRKQTNEVECQIWCR